jgi:hypothetical protein
MDITKIENATLTRREAVKITIAALGAGLVMTGCSKAPAPSTAAAEKNTENVATDPFFSADELTQLAEIAEIMIPTTDTPGARAANVHGFIDRMMSQWALPKTQIAFRALLGEINSSAKTQFGADFLRLSPQQRLDVVSAMDAVAFSHGLDGGKTNSSSQAKSRKVHPFGQMKQLVFLGYYQSEIGATKELQFKLAPGRYQACVPLSHIGRAWGGEPASLFAIQAQMRAALGGESH